MDPLALLQELVSHPGPPGQEVAVRDAVASHVKALELESRVDAKGNLIVDLGAQPRIVVTAHLDEIAMMVTAVSLEGSLEVRPLGGLYPWKIGEGPVQILSFSGPIDGVLSFGSIHTADVRSPIIQAKAQGVEWELATVITGLDGMTLAKLGVRPGTRVVVHPSRRSLMTLGELVSGYFLDDRADLVSWLLALSELRGQDLPVSFVATASEEVGGEGALYYLQEHRPEVCIALELGPNVPDAPVEITDQPTVWVTDSYSTMLADDIDLTDRVGQELSLALQFQALSSGGSDASCAASHGHCARPFTFGLPMENSHGYEIIHPGAMENLARLTVGIVKAILS